MIDALFNDRDGLPHDAPAKMHSLLAMLERKRVWRGQGDAPNVVSAMLIAETCDIAPGRSRERRRRVVRDLIRTIRLDHRIDILGDAMGYYLPSSSDDYDRAEARAKINGLTQIAEASRLRHSPGRHDASGQLGLNPE